MKFNGLRLGTWDPRNDENKTKPKKIEAGIYTN